LLLGGDEQLPTPYVHMSPAAARSSSADKAAALRDRLHPAHNAELCVQKAAAIVENSERIREYRCRLANLSVTLQPTPYYPGKTEPIKLGTS
jgi:hypothetical protein